jgi:hypothetical protein
VVSVHFAVVVLALVHLTGQIVAVAVFGGKVLGELLADLGVEPVAVLVVHLRPAPCRADNAKLQRAVARHGTGP